MPILEITPEENKILALKYQSDSLSKLSAVELLKTARLLILKIHVIVGWVIPEKELKDILIEQFIKKIKESYGNMNLDEIEYAFRQNTSVQDWGKSMNLALIDKVIAEYLYRRNDMSLLEEKYTTKPLELPAAKTDPPMEDDEFIGMNFKIWQTLRKVGMISIKCYGMLVAQNKISLTQVEKDEMYARVETNLKSKMYAEKAKHVRLRDDELITIYESNDTERWKIRVFNECKKKAVENYFKTLVTDEKSNQ